MSSEIQMSEESPLVIKQEKNRWYQCRIYDKWFEPFMLVGVLSSTGVFGWSWAVNVANLPWLALITAIICLCALFRIRYLAIAKSLSESADKFEHENNRLHQENQNLKNSITNLREQLDNFEGLVGLLGDNIDDIDEAKDKLFYIYQQYKRENAKQRANTLLDLFQKLDKDNSFALSQKELGVLKGLGKEIYGFEMNFDNIDKDDDGRVQMREFIRYANKISGVSDGEVQDREVQDDVVEKDFQK